ncbi:ATP phosphoribosyltransferase [Brevundimonas sp. Root1279]|uniref:ATP phosphoribosyltransferase n=1 Tax=Brevundimonas sp. Root1279 TaxID=1736443 RepID=UPI0006F68DD3|nr:ATP phosphoribosyltransferase [Brevundimonas sp. Root1279]KQW82910.1 ATP phosphoribosyltransferase [Brevundimonas sp. Root1279]
MSTVQGRLRIAVQKSGRLADRSLDLVRDAGLRVVKGNNDLLYRVENYPIDLLRVRDDDIPTFVADGVCDLGIVGENVLEEGRNGGPVAEVVMPLGFGRCTLKIAVPPTLDYAGPASLEGLRIATSYPRILNRYLAAEGVSADIVTMRGAVEVAPRLKLASAICDLVSTGATLEANGLAARETVLDSQAVLIRSPVPAEPGLTDLLDSIIERMAGVVASQGAKYVMLNAPRSALDKITAILPGAGSPTVIPLAGRDDAVAVHAVCQEAVFWETLEKLKAVGASAILVLPIEKMM